jgi:GT2 family glycosyltransferase/SAM-dependent methyltransferase/glycosyltransferase involved in cell wall biosynthesis
MIRAVSFRRRAAAPRLIEWTGERCVPWAPDVQVVYEHMHRYLWAAQLVAGKRVLDLGSGEGFGAAILSEAASEIVGVDLDERTVEHATLNWSSESISFLQGSALDLSAFEDGSFDAVVAFEIVEHVDDQGRMLAEIDRVLSDDGILIISTPDRRLYSEASGQKNPFHERELTHEEFSSLLESAFAKTAIWGQRTITGSHLGAIDLASDEVPVARSDFFIEREGEEWRIAGPPAGLYLVALASNAELPAAPASSTLGDCGLELLRARERDTNRAADELAKGLVVERDEAEQRASGAHVELERREADFAERETERDAQLVQRDTRLAERDELIAYQDGELTRGRTRISELEAGLVALHAQLEQARRLAARVESSVTWQTFQRVRGRLFQSLGGESAPAVRALRLSLRIVGRLLRGPSGAGVGVPAAPERPAGEQIHLPEFARPRVSLIIPLYSGAGLTRRCLETIRDHTVPAFEVILVDDTADPDTKGLLTLVHGAQVLHNEQNEGYLQSVNRGAAAARGEWLVLCNNDIEATPGWLENLLETGESGDDVGIVAPKFIAPDGLLSEAGGILWRDGTGVNYGRGDDPCLPRYEYTRDVDYGSAAALLVRASLWREIGGYDERFVPMYYEDADVCTEARQRGWRVLYEPSAVVVHAEGSTAGTDPSSGHKRHQEANRVKFVRKWQAVLQEHLPPDIGRVEHAARRHRGAHVLVVDFRTPMWDRDAGSLRMYEIIRSLQRLGNAVTFAPDNSAALEPYTRKLQRMGVEVIYGTLDVMPVLEEVGPRLTAAILSRPHPTSRWLDSVREFAPNAIVGYDTVDLHWVRESRRFSMAAATARRNGAPAVQGPRAAALFELELAMVRATDLTIAVSEEERAEILRHVPGARVLIIPTIHEIAQRVQPVNTRKDLLFVGGFEHPPNADAATYLVREVMPLVWRRRPDVSVTIVGGGVPPEVKALASPRVNVMGWVADLEPVLASSRTMVVPVRYGAGVKGKITQGLAAGLPVVTTQVGAEGLEGADGENMLIGEDADGLAERIVRVTEDDRLWQELSRRGRELVARKCSLEVLDDRLREMLGSSGQVRRQDHVPGAAGRSATTVKNGT